MNTFSIFYSYFLMSTFKTFGQEGIKDDSFLTTTGAISSIFAGLRWIWSYFYDKTSFKLTYGILLVLQIILSGLISFTNSNKLVYFIFVCLSLFCEGGHFTLVPAVTRTIFGKKASDVYGILLIYVGVSNVVSSILVNLLLKKLGYQFFYFLGCGFTIISLILLFFFEEKKRFR